MIFFVYDESLDLRFLIIVIHYEKKPPLKRQLFWFFMYLVKRDSFKYESGTELGSEDIIVKKSCPHSCKINELREISELILIRFFFELFTFHKFSIILYIINN